ncbi:UDP-N-acetylglucosamine--N-acetylmuramyl-(pentapeptide) pyrophosphoryl-undecaprenol N-acetylglucosamine transferase [Candidatus Woesebacteria bacterium]|nr:UDP-N-acetylglucosamine--N-acetylmuramyl-(pentapeptide) pyrophosphoryl-undecaprenol N-acetylglucosamine transferase [Candidatus Woesebacteria bacterium]
MNLYLTGGHLTPALAVVDELQKKHPKVKLFFVGREFSSTISRQPSHERSEITKRNIPFIPIDAAKYHRGNLQQSLVEITKILPSLWKMYTVFKQKRPNVVLSFGGYLAIPVCLVAKFFGARVVLHEQTAVAGLANQLVAWIADIVAVSSPDSLPFFPEGKTVVTGNPIRSSLFREYKVAPEWLSEISTEKPIIYITGGSQGSHIMNRTVSELLPRLTRDYVIVHQCGVSADHQNLLELQQEREKLSEEYQLRYIIREWVEERDVSYLFRRAKFVISRAGANTVQELTLAGTPAIFIPLQHAHNDEQFHNIEGLIKHDAGLLILQKDLVPDVLWETVTQMERQYDTIKENMQQEKQHLITNGTARLIELLVA